MTVPLKPHGQNHLADVTSTSSPPVDRALSDRHVYFGWWSLLVFLTLGIVLEALHGFKVGWYLDVGSETRRLTWTLAHAHGVLLAILHVVFGLTVRVIPNASTSGRQIASTCLLASSFLLPGGFFLGGVFIYDADPGLGIFLVPLGGLLLFVAVLQIARGCVAAPTPGSTNPDEDKSS
jgi:hypothetical protein